MTGLMVAAQSIPGLVLLGIAVLSSLQLFYRDRPPGEDLLHLTMTVIGRVMIVTAFVEASLVFLSFLAVPFGVVVVCILISVALRYRWRRQATLLAIMAAASRRWMTLAPAAEALGREWRGSFGGRCREVAQAIESGVPLGEALRAAGKQAYLPTLLLILLLVACFPITIVFAVFLIFRGRELVPPRALAMVEVGVRAGNVSGALTEAARQPSARPAWDRVAALLAYMGTIVYLGALLLTFMAVKIIPAFIKIFDDFDADLPPMTRVLIQLCDWFVTYGWPPLALGLLGVAAFALLFRFGVIAWLPPPLSAISRRRETAVVLRALALATEVNRPVDAALAALAEHHPSATIRERLRRTLTQMASGQPWTDCLARQGLLRRAELALIASAERAGNLTWALRDLADAIERRLLLRVQRWVEILAPMLVLAAGAVVGFIVVALFVPLIRLITNLA